MLGSCFFDVVGGVNFGLPQSAQGMNPVRASGQAGKSICVRGATRAEPESQFVWQGPHGRSWRVTPCGRGHTGGAGG